ncbi:MAG: hypothetical protein ACFFG0_41505 [Candidatus Thorarchaeota archaeon]
MAIKIKLIEIIDYLYEKYKNDNNFAKFVNETNLIVQIIQSLRKTGNVNKLNLENVQKVKVSKSDDHFGEPIENLIANSDGFSKIIFEDLKINRVLSEDKAAQEHLLNKSDIRECFSYLASNFNNVRLHQGKTWVIEYTGGL